MQSAPKADLCTLTSVADKGRRQSAAFRDIERWGFDVVVADSPMLPNELALISAQEEFVVSPADGGVALECPRLGARLAPHLYRCQDLADGVMVAQAGVGMGVANMGSVLGLFRFHQFGQLVA